MTAPSKLRFVLGNLALIVGLPAAALFVQAFVASWYDVPSKSMDPTFKVGDKIWVNKLARDLDDYERGDMVIFATNPVINDECKLPLHPNNGFEQIWWQTRSAFGLDPITTEDYTTTFTKRLVGLPGDTLSVKASQVYINGNPLAEEYVAAVPEKYQDRMYDLPETTVPDNSVVVLGDNRIWSCDSSMWGFLPATQLRGKVTAKVWPLSDAQFFASPDYTQTTAEQ